MTFLRVDLLVYSAVLLVGCTGSDGDPCQQEQDCDDGLLCCSAAGAPVNNGARGTCRAECAAMGCTPGDCAAGQFCELTSCNDTTGSCVDVPQTCSDEVNEVCACGDPRMPFNNQCLARRAERSSEPGACDAPDAGSEMDAGTVDGSLTDGGGDDGGTDATAADATAADATAADAADANPMDAS